MTIIAAIRTWFVPAPDSYAAGSVRKGKSPWIDAVHLLWSVWIFITPMFDHFTWLWAWLTLASYPVFLALFAKSVVAPRKDVGIYASGMLLLALGLLPWYPSGLTYFVFGCVMARSCSTSFHKYLAFIAVMNAACLLETWLLHYAWQAVVSIPVVCFTIGLVNAAERISDEKTAQLKLSHDEVRRLAATAERERIGRDLHDLLGHTLSLITLKLELSRKLFDRDSEAARRELEDAERVARHALAEVRAAVTGIRSTDLAAELASARLLLESSAVHLDYGNLPDSLPQEVERTLALVIREATTNIHRHAGATEASVRFTRTPEKLDMQICDNGKGGLASHGNGVSGMCERIRAIGGTLQIESPSRRGTRLMISVPLRMQKTTAVMGASPQTGYVTGSAA
ncbi:sensor histidine kinase [Dyella monticola]|uniref:Sensor histidine kinase n=1 Tax=Dyella monticola TaxID=1927958 RepID=A0A370X8V2_9GAMM|nr:sensor histidine kinase [Dyella monticola]RDS84701.1 sensor histidine kinase [Dyella monticola]